MNEEANGVHADLRWGLARCGLARQGKARISSTQEITPMADLGFVTMLKKGDVLERADVLKIMGMELDELQFGMLPPEVQLAGMIEKELHALGRHWTVKAFKGSVLILTDLQAFEHNKKRHRSGVKKFKRAIDGMAGVDISRFTSQERHEFDLESRKLSAQYIALKSARPTPMELLRPSPIGR